jgi:ABC-type polysaccharide/polyol phosphate transport system ATPase subunit
MDNFVRLKDLSVSIPVHAPSRLRLLRSPFSKIGGNLESSNGKVIVHALKEISLNIAQGEHLALIGHNGAGKSTLLRVIAGIIPASRGVVEVGGSVGCLFDIGGGIGGDLTGYECIKHQCLINNVGPQRWADIVLEVAEFTELGDYMHLPIRTYSDGMRARLFAALATAWTHEILLIDEGIGAGDRNFQDKFAKRLKNFMSIAGILVIASHSPALLRQYCKRALLLNHGEAIAYGELEDILETYAKSN